MNDSHTESHAALASRLAGPFKLFGRIGFGIQFIFLIVVALLGIYTFSVVGSRAQTENVIAFLGLAIPLFTTWWCWRYAQLGILMKENPDAVKPTLPLRRAWVGVWAGVAGVAVSVLSLFGAASSLLIVMLSNPQIGIQVSPATGGNSAYTISAFDAVSIMSLLLTLTAELLVVAISLRLVFIISKAMRGSATK
jgi:hypothetical protein